MRPFVLSLALIAGSHVVLLLQVVAASKTDAADARVDSTSSSGSKTRAAASTSPKRRHAIDADKAYKNNCMRCHTELPQYSPRMSKTILMHMRVDGNIPSDEADAILEYLRGAN
jgi:cytochrome c5